MSSPPRNEDFQYERQTICKCLARAYSSLFKLGSASGHWQEVRETSLVAMCLDLRENKGSPWQESAKEWLLEQEKTIDNDSASWGDELWDTCMALIALNRLGLPEKDPHYKKGLNFILSKYDLNGRHNWHDEPWETSWSLMAILEGQLDDNLKKIVKDSLQWLMNLQDSTGRIVSTHYTAYFIMISSKVLELVRNNVMVLNSDLQNQINNSRTMAQSYLLSVVNDSKLWTGEAWSNGQILWCLASSGVFPYNNRDLTRMVVNWFYNTQEDFGNWSDVEDTSSAILGLYFLLKTIELANSDASDVKLTLFNTLRMDLDTPPLIKHGFIVRQEDGTTTIRFTPFQKKIFWGSVAVLGALGTIVVLIQLVFHVTV